MKKTLIIFSVLVLSAVSCIGSILSIRVDSVSLNQVSYSVNVGEVFCLTATVHPKNASDKSVTWTAEPESVLKIYSDGQVEAVGKGEGIVIVTTNDGGHTARCSVSVHQNVESVSLDLDNLDLIVGQSALLTATVLPENASDKSVTWTAKPESVLRVDSNGRVEAIGAGQGIVTVTTNNGGFTAMCNVSVAPIDVESISLDVESLNLLAGQSASLYATVLPENATDKSVLWISSDVIVATVDQNGHVEALSRGKATITAKSGSKEATCLVEVSEEVSGGHEDTTIEIW